MSGRFFMRAPPRDWDHRPRRRSDPGSASSPRPARAPAERSSLRLSRLRARLFYWDAGRLRFLAKNGAEPSRGRIVARLFMTTANQLLQRRALARRDAKADLLILGNA